MNSLCKKLSAISVCLLLMAGPAGSSEFTGEPAPDFVLPTLHGANLRLSEYRSEVVVVGFWSSWCRRCRQAMPLYESLRSRYEAEGLNVLSVAVDGDADEARKMAADYDLKFPMLLDRKNEVSRLYDLGRLPMTLVIDREGNVVFVDEGFRDQGSALIAAQVARLMAE